jgi:hypothetical protein
MMGSFILVYELQTKKKTYRVNSFSCDIPILWSKITLQISYYNSTEARVKLVVYITELQWHVTLSIVDMLHGNE